MPTTRRKGDRDRMEKRALKRKLSTDQFSDVSDLPSGCRKIGAEYLITVLRWVSKHRYKTFVLQNPVGATLIVGPLEDTIYSENDDEVNGWGKFYLPDIVTMQVVGVVEESCPCNQLILMTCEDKNIYIYDGEKLHLVASSLDQLRSDGIEFPPSQTFYKGEAFKDMTKEDWAEVGKGRVDRKLDEERKWMKANKSRILKNLQLGREKQRYHQKLGGGPLDDNMLSTLLSKHLSVYTEEHANSTQKDPRLQFEPRSCDTTVPITAEMGCPLPKGWEPIFSVGAEGEKRRAGAGRRSPDRSPATATIRSGRSGCSEAAARTLRLQRDGEIEACPYARYRRARVTAPLLARRYIVACRAGSCYGQSGWSPGAQSIRGRTSAPGQKGKKTTINKQKKTKQDFCMPPLKARRRGAGHRGIEAGLCI